MNTHQPPLFMPNYADIVRPEERDAMRTWLEQTLAAVRTTAVPPPQAAVRCIRQRGFDGVCYRGLARNGQPLRLKGTVYPAGIGMATGTALRVDLPSPGRRFTCRAGVQDSNAPTNDTPRCSMSSLMTAGSCGAADRCRPATNQRLSTSRSLDSAWLS